MPSPRLAWHLFTMELSRIAAYPVDFWLGFAGGILAEAGVAYFLWTALFAQRGGAPMGGFTLPVMLFYVMLIPLLAQVIRGQENSNFAMEIYDGSLTRFLVYPVSVFWVKYLSHLAACLMAAAQLCLLLGLYRLLFDTTPGGLVHVGSIFWAMSTIWLSLTLYFLIEKCIEMVAFWVDHVWSLIVMLRFCIRFLGGAMVPLALFPEWSQGLLKLTPFPYLAGFPLRVMLDQVTRGEWWLGVAVMLAWMAAVNELRRWLWAKGSKNYAGVGI